MSEREEMDLLKSRLAAVEQLLDVHEQTVLEQSDRLSKASQELEARAQAAEQARHQSEHSAERMRFLAEAGKTLASSLDYETTLRNVAELAVPAIADWCVVDLVDPTSGLKRIAIAHADPAMVRLVEELRERYPDDPKSPYGVHEVVRTGQAQMMAHIPPEVIQAAAVDEEHRRLLESLNLGSYIVAPLRTREATLGALTLVCEGTESCYTDLDFEMVQELATRAAIAIENARLVRELETTQQHLEQSAAELEAQTEELQSTVEELESTTQDLLEANEDLQAAKEEAEQARQTAEEANASKSQFLATMSHELRTPLNAIDGYAELIEMGIHGPVTDSQHEALSRLRRAQKRLLSLINDVLNFAKLEAGQVLFEYRDVPIAALLTDLEALVAPQVATRRQHLIIDPVDLHLQVHADAEKTEQILLNLLANAMKFTDEGGTIRITAKGAGARVSISVSDTGRGIPADRLKSIFDPFVQVESGMVRDQNGVGLGLAISRDLAVTMGGDLRVTSELGRGSVFTLVLPLAIHAAHGQPTLSSG